MSSSIIIRSNGLLPQVDIELTRIPKSRFAGLDLGAMFADSFDTNNWVARWFRTAFMALLGYLDVDDGLVGPLPISVSNSAELLWLSLCMVSWSSIRVGVCRLRGCKIWAVRLACCLGAGHMHAARYLAHYTRIQ